MNWLASLKWLTGNRGLRSQAGSATVAERDPATSDPEIEYMQEVLKDSAERIRLLQVQLLTMRRRDFNGESSNG